MEKFVYLLNFVSMGVVSAAKLGWSVNFLTKELVRDNGLNSIAIILHPNRHQQTDVERETLTVSALSMSHCVVSCVVYWCFIRGFRQSVVTMSLT